MQKIKENIPSILKAISQTISAHEGKCYLVGGAVIDLLKEETPKDWDVEVFHKTFEELELILQRFGETKIAGKKFGVLRFKKDDFNVEFSLPRTENSIGIGHKDFDIKLCPNLSVKEAATRRDFTINAIYYDLQEEKILDFFNGYLDLTLSRLQIIKENSFKEDPLRVYRGMQLLSRKVSNFSSSTKRVASRMFDSCSQLSKDSISQEWEKMLFGERPDRGLKFLKEIDFLAAYPELNSLENIPQSLKYHGEGNVWNHTLLVIKEAAEMRKELSMEWQLPFMYAALLHDVGKAETTVIKENYRISSIGHEEAGLPLVQSFMERLTNSQDLIDKVKALVKDHLQPVLWLKNNTKRYTWAKLQNRCPIQILAYLVYVDKAGRFCRDKDQAHIFSQLLEKWKELGSPIEKIPPIFQGKDLINYGIKQSPNFSKYLDKAYQYQLRMGVNDKDILYQQTKAWKEE